jgi:DNA repair photolyase
VFVRWSNLTLSEDQERRLPGYRDPASVRRFSAPEALDMRFYEVQAKSILNRVPEKSRMPFRWSINPYRGCSHACCYCLHGRTPILMADGTHRGLGDLDVGDTIYGTELGPRYRRYAPTTVLAKWITIKPAFRVTLEDGTELIASGDHRFLTNRGWKHVTGTEQGSECRPHLTLDDTLVGPGHFADQPEATLAYRRGYLCGLIRGDGCIWRSTYGRANGTTGEKQNFGLSLTDLEALWRAKTHLECASVDTNQRVFQQAVGACREVVAVSTGRRRNVQRVRGLIRWPQLVSREWCRGFLAGILDAGGSRSDFVLRIANTDPEIVHWTASCLTRLGFRVACDRTGHPNGMTCVRIRGGLAEHLRFLHLTDPAITRMRSIEGQMVETLAKLRVVSVEPLSTMPLYDITTGTGDFIANGVVSHNCFARPTHKYLDFDAGRDFEREIVVKVNAPEVLRAELARPSWKGEHVALGTNTDPYQWVEGRYRLMQGIWEALRDAANPCSVLTKSPLLLRDLALMVEIAERTQFSACLSIPTLDEKVWRETEPHTPNPRARLEAVAELNRAGIPTGVLIAPLMPGINDAPHQLEPLLAAATEAGARSIGGIALHLRPGVKEVFMGWLGSQRPDLVADYERMYRGGAYAPHGERERLASLVRSGEKPGALWRTPGETGHEHPVGKTLPSGQGEAVSAQEKLF